MGKMNKKEMTIWLTEVVWEGDFIELQIKSTLDFLKEMFQDDTEGKLDYLADPFTLCDLRDDIVRYEIEYLIGEFDEGDTESLETAESIAMNILNEVINILEQEARKKEMIKELDEAIDDDFIELQVEATLEYLQEVFSNNKEHKIDYLNNAYEMYILEYGFAYNEIEDLVGEINSDEMEGAALAVAREIIERTLKIVEGK